MGTENTVTTAAVPFATTTLEVRWISRAEACRLGSYVFFDSAAVGLPYYRCTASVAAWFNRKMAIAMNRADSGNDSELAAALLESGSIDRYWEIANWADRVYGDEVVSAALPELPRVEYPPPDDAPPADPVVWGGAFDDARANRPAPTTKVTDSQTIVIQNAIEGRVRTRSRSKSHAKAAREFSLFGEG